MTEVKVVDAITPPVAKRCNIITIDGAPIIVIYDFKGADFRDNLTMFLEKAVRSFTALHRKEPKE